ncbi:hypothetical protein HYX70_03645 [Candidatus Saccharibacteria bacterium]|nr:hypothetical protein [Candidatus Saccharibacteria bacterium]
MLQALPKKILKRISHHFYSPTEILAEINVRAGANVLEIGLPVGFFATALLGKVGDQGRVYITGPNQESLEKLAHLTARENFHPVMLADVLAGHGLAQNSIDLVILTNLLSKSYHPDKFCLSLGQYLKPDSEVVLIDWDATQTKHVGPVAERRVSREDALKLLTACGMQFKRVLNIPGYHYGLVFGMPHG